jgi:hypothetical protein
MDTKMWKRILPKMKMEQLLPKDKKLLEWLEQGGRPGGDEDFEKLLDKIVADAKRKKGIDGKGKRHE